MTKELEGVSSKTVGFQGQDDPSDPLNWSTTYKWSVVCLVSMFTTVVTFATLMCTPATPQILDEFESHNTVYPVILVSIWELGEGIGVLIIAPLSELFGRLPVWHTANVLFCLFSVTGALSTNIHMLIAFRFLNGVAVVALALEPAIISDLFPQEKRGMPMALTSIAPLLGPVVAPIIGSYLSQARGWRWVFWLVTVVAGTFEVLSIFVLRETYRVKILRKKTQRLRSEMGDVSLVSQYGDAHGSNTSVA
ncbi:MAG: hypothetical protein ALECFALPRED_001352 [Alectoria fallacina]|uniref:Major facilitator superfamily (MFS) profile domain-containing protein n=1 Tax=Alectoria fallacina TaxID=1903189 RepID=A0A8H3EKP9_9LECA|nr:MAG: hypothetical protein ALECFALPRED_001352 [Alectoria fallacina]